MGVLVSWFNDNQRTILYTFTGDWTVDEFLAVVDDAIAMRQSHPTPTLVDVIVDMRNSGEIPSTIVRHLRQFNSINQDSKGYIVVVGLGRLGHSLLSLVHPLLPNLKPRMKLVHTIAEADHLLAMKDVVVVGRP